MFRDQILSCVPLFDMLTNLCEGGLKKVILFKTALHFCFRTDLELSLYSVQRLVLLMTFMCSLKGLNKGGLYSFINVSIIVRMCPEGAQKHYINVHHLP